MGLNKLRLTTLYAQPGKYRSTPLKKWPDIADIIRDYIKIRDSAFIQGMIWSGNYYYLSQKAEIYVEVIDQGTAIFGDRPEYHVIQMNIYCNDEEEIRGIAQAVTQGADRVTFLAHLDWKKIERCFNTNKDDCLVEWKKWLNPLSPTALSSLPVPRPPRIKPKTAHILQYLFNVVGVVFVIISIASLVLWMDGLTLSTPFWGLPAIFFNIFFWGCIGCFMAAYLIGFQKELFEQYILEQRLLSEENPQGNTLNLPISSQNSPIPASLPFDSKPMNTILCNQCGSRNPQGTLFCQSCGFAIESSKEK